MAPDGLRIQSAQASDVPLILSLIRELSRYEKLAHMVQATEQGLREALFGERPVAEAFVARLGDEPVGYALIYTTFSTFAGKPGIWIEDLFVRPAHRGKGVGKALLAYVLSLARRRGCGRIEWTVLDWNTSAIRFYESIGAKAMNQWRLFRVETA